MEEAAGGQGEGQGQGPSQPPEAPAAEAETSQSIHNLSASSVESRPNSPIEAQQTTASEQPRVGGGDTGDLPAGAGGGAEDGGARSRRRGRRGKRKKRRPPPESVQAGAGSSGSEDVQNPLAGPSCFKPSTVDVIRAELAEPSSAQSHARAMRDEGLLRGRLSRSLTRELRTPLGGFRLASLPRRRSPSYRSPVAGGAPSGDPALKKFLSALELRDLREESDEMPPRKSAWQTRKGDVVLIEKEKSSFNWILKAPPIMKSQTTQTGGAELLPVRPSLELLSVKPVGKAGKIVLPAAKVVVSREERDLAQAAVAQGRVQAPRRPEREVLPLNRQVWGGLPARDHATPSIPPPPPEHNSTWLDPWFGVLGEWSQLLDPTVKTRFQALLDSKCGSEVELEEEQSLELLFVLLQAAYLRVLEIRPSPGEPVPFSLRPLTMVVEDQYNWREDVCQHWDAALLLHKGLNFVMPSELRQATERRPATASWQARNVFNPEDDVQTMFQYIAPPNQLWVVKTVCCDFYAWPGLEEPLVRYLTHFDNSVVRPAFYTKADMSELNQHLFETLFPGYDFWVSTGEKEVSLYKMDTRGEPKSVVALSFILPTTTVHRCNPSTAELSAMRKAVTTLGGYSEAQGFPTTIFDNVFLGNQELLGVVNAEHPLLTEEDRAAYQEGPNVYLRQVALKQGPPRWKPTKLPRSLSMAPIQEIPVYDHGRLAALRRAVSPATRAFAAILVEPNEGSRGRKIANAKRRNKLHPISRTVFSVRLIDPDVRLYVERRCHYEMKREGLFMFARDHVDAHATRVLEGRELDWLTAVYLMLYAPPERPCQPEGSLNCPCHPGLSSAATIAPMQFSIEGVVDFIRTRKAMAEDKWRATLAQSAVSKTTIKPGGLEIHLNMNLASRMIVCTFCRQESICPQEMLQHVFQAHTTVFLNDADLQRSGERVKVVKRNFDGPYPQDFLEDILVTRPESIISSTMASPVHTRILRVHRRFERILGLYSASLKETVLRPGSC